MNVTSRNRSDCLSDQYATIGELSCLCARASADCTAFLTLAAASRIACLVKFDVGGIERLLLDSVLCNGVKTDRHKGQSGVDLRILTSCKHAS